MAGTWALLSVKECRPPPHPPQRAYSEACHKSLIPPGKRGISQSLTLTDILIIRALEYRVGIGWCLVESDLGDNSSCHLVLVPVDQAIHAVRIPVFDKRQIRQIDTCIALVRRQPINNLKCI